MESGNYKGGWLRRLLAIVITHCVSDTNFLLMKNGWMARLRKKETIKDIHSFSHKGQCKIRCVAVRSPQLTWRMLTYMPVYAKICANSLKVWVSDKEVLCTHAHHIYILIIVLMSCSTFKSTIQYVFFVLALQVDWHSTKKCDILFEVWTNTKSSGHMWSGEPFLL